MHTEKMVVLIQKATIYDLMRLSMGQIYHRPIGLSSGAAKKSGTDRSAPDRVTAQHP